MKNYKLAAAACLIVGGVSSVAVTAAPVSSSHYFVRPALRVGGGGLQDGLQVNGPTVASQFQGVTGISSSEVSLRDGTVKMYAEELFSSEVGLQAFGSFGERLTIRNGAGTRWDMSFGIEGEIFGEVGPSAPGAPPASFVYNVGLVVFDAGIANWSNFLGLANDPCWGQDPLACNPVTAARVNRQSQKIYRAPVEDWDPVGDNFFYEDVYAAVAGSVLLDSNNQAFDVFAYTNIFLDFGTAGADSGLEEYTMDFENTASYSQSLEAGVDLYSSSGEFLGLSAPPPIDPPGEVSAPGALQLSGLGLLALWFHRRRRMPA